MQNVQNRKPGNRQQNRKGKLPKREAATLGARGARRQSDRGFPFWRAPSK